MAKVIDSYSLTFQQFLEIDIDSKRVFFIFIKGTQNDYPIARAGSERIIQNFYLWIKSIGVSKQIKPL